MDRSFSTPPSFTGDFWVAGFGVSYLVTKVLSWLAPNLLQNTLALVGWPITITEDNDLDWTGLQYCQLADCTAL
jgi:hypothetical protein